MQEIDGTVCLNGRYRPAIHVNVVDLRAPLSIGFLKQRAVESILIQRRRGGRTYLDQPSPESVVSVLGKLLGGTLDTLAKRPLWL